MTLAEAGIIVAIAGSVGGLAAAFAHSKINEHKLDEDPHPGRYVPFAAHAASVQERNAALRATSEQLGKINGKLEHITGILEEMRAKR